MRYKKTVEARFIDRPNRFIAHVELNGIIETVHVKNTGRCKELLLPDVRVILAEAENPNRKTKFDLVGVYKENIGLINMDSQAPNQVVKEWLMTQQVEVLKPEYTYGKSRIDFYFEREGKKCLMEVKGVTLEREGIAYFPDAPTERGVKHLEELAEATKKGYECYLAFAIQMEGITEVRPNMETHPAFGEALKKAQQAGVKILCLPCHMTENTMVIDAYSSLP